MLNNRTGKSGIALSVILLMLVIFGSLISLHEASAAGSLISTSTASDATNGSFNPKFFMASGRFWAVLSDGANMVYSSSLDGLSWTSPTIIRTGVLHGSLFGTYSNGTHFAYAYAASTPIFYRLGMPLSNGTIVWVAPEQSFAAGSVPTVSFDSSGFIWVGFTFNGNPWIIRNEDRNGSWDNDTASPFNGTAIQLSNTIGSWSVFPQPMTADKMYVFYGLTGNGINGNGIKGRVITPGSPAPSEEIVTSNALVFGEAYSSVSHLDNVFVTYTKKTGDMAYEHRSPSGPWSSETTVQTGNPNTSYPALAFNTSSNSLVAFWANAPMNNMLYYKRCIGGVSCTWDASPTLLEDESTDGNVVFPSAYYQDGVISGGHYLALEYGTNSTTLNTYKVKFASLSWPPPTPSLPENLNATGGIRNDTLKWQPPTLGGRAPITGYRIYRGVSTGGESATPLAQIGNLTSYMDTSVTGGVTYFYKVSAVNSLGESSPSNEASATPTSPPQPPTNLQVTSGYLKNTLTWNRPTSNGGLPITHFRLYRGSTSGGETVLTTVGNQTTYIDWSAAYGKTYYYKITAINSLGESTFSNEATPGTGVSALPILPFTLILLTILVLRIGLRATLPFKRNFREQT